MFVLSRSVVSDSLWPYGLTVACQALSMRFSRQEYWSGLPFTSPRDLPDPGIKPTSPVSHTLAGRFFTTEPPRKRDQKMLLNNNESESEVAQSCLTLCNLMNCSLPGSPIHGIFQARVLEWVAISFSRASSRPRDRTQVSLIVDRRFTFWVTRGTCSMLGTVLNA